MKLFGLQIEASRDSRGHETPELKNRVPAILALLPGPASGNGRSRGRIPQRSYHAPGNGVFTF
ncbi:hypothetical protein C5Q97_11585 [Victivallales bacterium CCUG 44730]|nr:hypothetical protein C5Q97_11585 [Victivallales bacterium CCUG 44730]